VVPSLMFSMAVRNAGPLGCGLKVRPNWVLAFVANQDEPVPG